MVHIEEIVPSLTPELWAKVFALVEERPDTLGSWDDSIDTLAWQNQQEVHQLKLVCKQFKKIYASHAGLIQRLYLCDGFAARLLPALLAWLQQNKNSVQTFHSAEGRPVDAVLAGLVTSEQCLRIADVYNITAFSLSLLATFTSLEKCALWRESAERLDLAPLGGLPRLQHLVLHGQFQELHHLAGLTRLECIMAVVADVQEFAPSLEDLTIEDSHLLDMHTQGFSSCTALTHLELSNVSLMDSNEKEYLDADLSVIPTNIELLTQLHTLHLSTSSDEGIAHTANLGWISHLTSLQDLSISCDRSRGQVLQDVLSLTRLTRLDILGLSDSLNKVLDLNIEWHRLQALQELSLCKCRLHLGHDVAGLLQLHHLRHISFAESTIDSPDDDECFAALMYNFARLRPQVKLVFDSGDLLSYFE